MDSWYGAGSADWEMEKHSPLWLEKKIICLYPSSWKYWSNTQKGAMLVVGGEMPLMDDIFFIKVLGKLATTRLKNLIFF